MAIKDLLVFAGGKGEKGEKGEKGDPYTLTEGDKQEIVVAVIESLGGNPVFGYVDSDTMTIVLQNAPDGEYSLAYIMEDGTLSPPIGSMVKDTNVYYTVTSNLTNCTSNGASEAIGGQSYTATITANSGYELSGVTVTMGGTDITASAVSGGNISIGSVTGNIVITAVAEETVVLGPVTENLTLTTAKRIGSDGTLRDQAGYSVTDDINLSSIPKPCTLQLTGSKWACAGSETYGQVTYYAKKQDGTGLSSGGTNETNGSEYFTLTCNNTDGTDVTVTIISDEVGSIRFCGNHTYNGGTFANAAATLTYTPNS